MRQRTLRGIQFGTALSLVVLAAAIPGANASDGKVSAHYAVSFLGLPLGEGTMTSTTDGVSYTTTLNARVGGIARLFAPGHGTAVASGRVVGDRTLASSFRTEIHTRGQVETTAIGMAAGNVQSVSISPQKPPHPQATPVPDNELRGVLDPLSAGIFVTPGTGPVVAAGACNRRSRIYNGRERFDLIFSFVAVRPVEIGGYKGDAVVCSVRYEPVAGYRRDRTDHEQARQRRAEIVLVPVKGLRSLIPARISIQTGFGTGIAQATRLDLDPGLPTTRRAAAQ